MRKFFLLIAMVAATCCWAADDSVEVDRADIPELAKLIELTWLDGPYSDRMWKMFVLQVAQQQGKEVEPEVVITELKKPERRDQFIKEAMAIYHKLFSDDEIRAIYAYHSSATGKKESTSGVELNMGVISGAQTLIADVLNSFSEEELAASTVEHHSTEVTIDNYSAEVENASMPVVIDAYASWCGPCKMMKPIFEGLAADYGNRYKFVRFDVDAESALAQKLGVKAMPTFFFVKEGKVVGSHSGMATLDELLKKIQEHLD